MTYGTEKGGSTTGPADVSVDAIGGVDFQRVKLVDGTEGSTTPIPGGADGLLVNLGANNDVTVASLPLPTGAATLAKQDTIIGHVDGIEGLLTTIDADTGTIAGAVAGTEMQVDVVTMPAVTVTGVSTLAEQQSQTTHLANIATSTGTLDNAIAGTEMQVDVVAALPAGTNNIGDVDVASIAAGDNNIGNVDIVTMPAVTGTVTASNVTGNVAHDSPDSGNPVKIGGKAETTTPAAVADGDRVDAWFNEYGAQQVGTGPGFTRSTTATFGALNDQIVISCAGAAEVILSFTEEGDLDGDIGIGGSYDGGATYPIDVLGWLALAGIYQGGVTGAQIAVDESIIVNPNFTDTGGNGPGGFTHLRFYVSAYTSGAVDVIVRATAYITAPQVTRSLLYDGASQFHPQLEGGQNGVAAVAGGVPHDTADSGNPLKVGMKAATAVPTAVAAADRVNAWGDVYGRPIVQLGVPISTEKWATAQYTSQQTGVALLTPTGGKKLVITSYQIQVGGTTAGTVQLWFGGAADTTYSRGTDRAIFDGEFAPSATLKPGALQTKESGWVAGAADDVLRVTTSAAINPITFTVWGYEV